jgi:D-alanyl-lipoteichoic acid acyltransferase DltB (MBOAT superfamily)
MTFVFSKGKERTMFTNVNLMTTMLLGGLWHGASLRFIIWGALHGMALAVHKLFSEYFPERKDNPKTGAKMVWNFISVVITFHFVAFCWLFFRAKDFTTALDVINNISLVTFSPDQWQTIILGYKNVFMLMLVGYVWHFLPDGFSTGLKNIFYKMPLIVKGIILGLVMWLVYAAAAAGPQPFIYFQF